MNFVESVLQYTTFSPGGLVVFSAFYDHRQPLCNTSYVLPIREDIFGGSNTEGPRAPKSCKVGLGKKLI